MVEYVAYGLPTALAVCTILLGVCLFLGILHIRSTKKHLAFRRLASKRACKISDTMRMFRMAEDITGLGVWQYSPKRKKQTWSQGMKTLFGLEADEVVMPGDMEALLSSNGIDLIAAATNAGQIGKELSAQYSIVRLDGEKRVLDVRATRTKNQLGQTRTFTAVLMDVTDQTERESELENSRQMAVEQAQEARELAETDPLTGLANRRRIMAVLDQLVMQARRKKQKLCLIIFDIDHFKNVNDSYGHPAGDCVIKRVAQIACEQARKEDIVGRIGGEEFVWIVPGADMAFARVISERLRQAIALDSGVGNVPAVTVSIGFASPEVDDTSLTLFARADDALYDAKNSGRNMVRMAA